MPRTAALPVLPVVHCTTRYVISTSETESPRRLWAPPSIGRMRTVSSGEHRSQVRRRPIVDVREWGATGDGKELDTDAIQRAVVEASKSGATVRVPEGTYLVGTI